MGDNKTPTIELGGGSKEIPAGPNVHIEPPQVDGGDTPAQMSMTTRRFPIVGRANPRVWCAQVEHMFKAARVTSQRTMFTELVCQLDPDVLAAIEDVFEMDEAKQTYTMLKARLMEQFSDSEAKRLQRLLQDVSLEDKKPSTLLREMRTLAGQRVTEDFLKGLWLQRLPAQMQAILAMSNVELTELAAQADRVAEVTPSAHVNVVSHESSQIPIVEAVSTISLGELTKMVVELTRAVARLTEHRSRSQSRGRQSNQRSSTPNRSEDG